MILFSPQRALLVLACSATVVLASCQIPVGLAATSTIGEGTTDIPESETPEPAKPALAPGYSSVGWEDWKSKLSGPTGIANTYTQIKTDEKVIAITFDDGPHPQNTPRLLDILKKRNIKATFYVVGNMVKYHPQILKRTVEEGHEIGNHTVTHGTLSRMSNAGLRKELADAHQQIVEITGIAPRTMRPPGGAIKSAQKDYMMKEFGYPTILWSVDPEDWKRPGVSVVTSRLINGARPGGILLVHDLHKPTIDAMESTLDQLLAKGYRFVTMTELIAMDQSGEK